MTRAHLQVWKGTQADVRRGIVRRDVVARALGPFEDLIVGIRADQHEPRALQRLRQGDVLNPGDRLASPDGSCEVEVAEELVAAKEPILG